MRSVLLYLGRNAKKVQHRRSLHWHRVPNASANIPNQLRPVTIKLLRPHGARNSRRVLGEAQPQNIAPLRELHAQQRRTHQRIRRPVPKLQPRPRSGVARVGIPRKVAPLLRRLGDLALRAGLVAAERTGLVLAKRAAEGDAGEARAGAEHVRVRARQHVGHHRAGRAAEHKDVGAVAAVRAEGVVDHADDAVAVAAAAARECFGVVHGPTPVLVAGLRVDQGKVALDGGAGQVACGEEIRYGVETAMELGKSADGPFEIWVG